MFSHFIGIMSDFTICTRQFACWSALLRALQRPAYINFDLWLRACHGDQEVAADSRYEDDRLRSQLVLDFTTPGRQRQCTQQRIAFLEAVLRDCRHRRCATRIRSIVSQLYALLSLLEQTNGAWEYVCA
jgi:hypothetical protein